MFGISVLFWRVNEVYPNLTSKYTIIDCFGEDFLKSFVNIFDNCNSEDNLFNAIVQPNEEGETSLQILRNMLLL